MPLSSLVPWCPEGFSSFRVSLRKSLPGSLPPACGGITFWKARSGIYYHFHSFALPELENLFSVYQSLFLFLFFFGLCVHVHCLFVSWVWHFSCLFHGILYMKTIDIFLTVSIFCLQVSLYYLFFFLDSSFFGFCETDLQGASKSSGMPFFILFQFILYIYAFFIPKDWRNNWRGANFIMNT